MRQYMCQYMYIDTRFDVSVCYVIITWISAKNDRIDCDRQMW